MFSSHLFFLLLLLLLPLSHADAGARRRKCARMLCRCSTRQGRDWSTGTSTSASAAAASATSNRHAHFTRDRKRSGQFVLSSRTNCHSYGHLRTPSARAPPSQQYSASSSSSRYSLPGDGAGKFKHSVTDALSHATFVVACVFLLLYFSLSFSPSQCPTASRNQPVCDENGSRTSLVAVHICSSALPLLSLSPLNRLEITNAPLHVDNKTTYITQFNSPEGVKNVSLNFFSPFFATSTVIR